MKKYLREKPKYIYVIFFAILLISVFVVYPKSLLIIIALIIIGFIENIIESRKVQRHYETIFSSRGSLSICEFSREFNCSEIDTWIIRAAYEQIQGMLLFKERIPIKASDRLKEDLLIDDDDLDFDLLEEISQRTGRTLNSCESNPYFGKVKTVRDLVLFFNCQQKLT